MVGSPRHMAYQYGEQTARIMNNKRTCTTAPCVFAVIEVKRTRKETKNPDIQT